MYSIKVGCSSGSLIKDADLVVLTINKSDEEIDMVELDHYFVLDDESLEELVKQQINNELLIMLTQKIKYV